jgi:hypothetical protein
MRHFFSILLLLFSTTIFGQTNDSITFCSQNFKVPTGCSTEKNKIKRDDFMLSWTYMSDVTRGNSDEEKLKGMEDAYLQMGSWLEKFKKKRITCYLLDKEVKGYKVSYKSDKTMTYQIYASGVINGESVSVILDTNKELVTNEDIPEFARQIIRLKK